MKGKINEEVRYENARAKESMVDSDMITMGQRIEYKLIGRNTICPKHNSVMTFGRYSSKPNFNEAHKIVNGKYYYCDTCVNEIEPQRGDDLREMYEQYLEDMILGEKNITFEKYMKIATE